MYRHFYYKCLLIAGLAGASLTSPANAQVHLIDKAKGEANRVIQLKNRVGAEVQGKLGEVSTRSTRLASNPLSKFNNPASPKIPKLTSAPQVAYEEIGSPNVQISGFNSQSVSGFNPQAFTTPQVQIDQPTLVEHLPVPRVYVDKQTPAAKVAYTKPSRGAATAATTSAAAPLRRSESAPFVTTTISAPEFVNVNETVPVRIDLRNPGKVTVHDVTLVARIAANVKIHSRQGIIENGTCSFKISSLEPGENRQLALDVIATEKQSLDIQTALTVSNRSNVSVGVRQPKLTVSVQGPTQANIGSETTHVITVTNTGDGIARDVNLIADIPESLRIIKKSGFETPETLRPGQQSQARIVTVPHKSGQTELAFAAAGEFCKASPAQAGLRVTQPELRVAAIGPDMNFVERDGIYTITVDNPGEVDVNNVKVQFAIPEGVKITTISRQAKMDSQRGTLVWTYDRIPSQTQQTIQLKAVASSAGAKHSRIRVASDETNEKEVALKTIIATRADLSIQMQNVGGPVQVGSEATFVVMVENRGSSVARDMEIEVQLPVGMRPASPEDGVVDQDSNSILFADSELRPGKVREFKFSAFGVEKGEHVVRSSLESVGSKQRITVENSVFVYEPSQARVSELLQPVIPR